MLTQRRAGKVRPRRLSARLFALSLAGILLYNNWLLAFFLNAPAIPAGATSSELGATNQPGGIWFRLIDASAAALLLLGMRVVVSIGNNHRQRLALAITMLALGVSTIVEAFFLPLDCSSALSVACARKEQLGMIDLTHQLHIIESVVAYTLIALLPAAVAWSCRRRVARKRLAMYSWTLFGFMVVWGIEALVQSMRHASKYGFEQRTFITLLTLWFVALLWEVWREQHAGAKHPARRPVRLLRKQLMLHSKV